MRIKLPKLNHRNTIKCLIISLFVVIGTFPENDWSVSSGIDSPLKWVFNHLFENGLNIGKNIIFPHGPLAFFMYPLQENILLSVFVTSLLKGLLAFNICWLFAESNNHAKWLAVFVFAYAVSLVANFNFLILANIILLYCNYYVLNNKAFKLLAFFLTAFAFFVKSYVAIVSGALFFSFLMYFLLKNKNFKNIFLDGVSLLGFILLFWVFMYGTLNGIGQYVLGMLHLGQENSSAASYYPHNNWIVLAFCLALVITLFAVNRTKKSVFFGMLVAFSLFAAWKHGMAREDIFHTKGLLIYLAICLSVFILFYKKNSFLNLSLSIMVVFLFSINIKNAVNYFPYKYELISANNFVEFISDFSNLKQKAIEKTEQNLFVNKLPQMILEKISNSTVDVYPWDYSIIAINNLNWQPRPIIQSYTSYTTWLDEKNVEHFKSATAPEFLIWENNKTSVDINGGDFNSIDNRYLLNDEPKTILELISNYDHCYSERKFSLYKKRDQPIPILVNSIGKNESTWEKWIKVPEYEGGLLRAKLNFRKTIPERLKSFFYKDEQFWAYLKLTNGEIHKYKIVPKNATDGLWINPYVFNSDKNYTVTNIMFMCSNQRILTKNLSIDWEKIEFENNPMHLNNFFRIIEPSTDSIILNSVNDYEQPNKDYWNYVGSDQLTDASYSGLKSHILQGVPYSSTFSMAMDSIPFCDLRITADCWLKSSNYKGSNSIILVLAINDENGSVIWKGISIDDQLLDKNHWNNIFNFVEYKHQKAKCTLNAYVWNTSNEKILIDDFKVMITTD